MVISLLTDIVVIFGLAVIVVYICNRFHVPTLVGFLVTGVLAGPYGFKLISVFHEVETLAEIGVILLLFTIGIEFSLRKLLKIKKIVLLAGSFQVISTIAIVYVIARYFSQSSNQAIYWGFLFALSSTAIVLKLLRDKVEIDSPHGRMSLGILIFQDIIIVPMILVTPFLANSGADMTTSVPILIAKCIGIVGMVIVLARWVIPHVLYQIARTRNRELFLLSIVVLCFAIAWATYKLGLSLSLGSFLAGLIISESHYSRQALGDILPFRTIFTSLFFISIGMLFNTRIIMQHPVQIILLTAAIIVIKSLTGCISSLILKYPLRTSILAGLAICQVGEFSFILSRSGLEYDLLSGYYYQLFLACSIMSMAATPFLIARASVFADLVVKLPFPEGFISGFEITDEGPPSSKKGHLIIIGYGVTGRHLAQAGNMAGLPYEIIDMNPDTVETEIAKGEPIHYGDATGEDVLHHCNIKDARIAVIAINDSVATRRIIEVVKSLNPAIHLIVRTKYVAEMKTLFKLGADEIITEEYETSIEIFSRVLSKFLLPRSEIEAMVHRIRADGYEMIRGLSLIQDHNAGLKPQLADLEICNIRVPAHSSMAGKTLSETGIRKRFSITVLVIRRGTEIIPNPNASTVIQGEDILVLLGKPDTIFGLMDAFSR